MSSVVWCIFKEVDQGQVGLSTCRAEEVTELPWASDCLASKVIPQNWDKGGGRRIVLCMPPWVPSGKDRI